MLLWSLKQPSKPFCGRGLRTWGEEAWGDNLEENKVTMALSEHLSIHLHLAYKEDAILELHNLILSPTKMYYGE